MLDLVLGVLNSRPPRLGVRWAARYASYLGVCTLGLRLLRGVSGAGIALGVAREALDVASRGALEVALGVACWKALGVASRGALGVASREALGLGVEWTTLCFRIGVWGTLAALCLGIMVALALGWVTLVGPAWCQGSLVGALGLLATLEL